MERTPERDRTFMVSLRLTVGSVTDAHLQSPQAIADEIVSWLTDLRAAVHELRVEEATE